METVLGLFALVVFIVCVIGLAAAMTTLVVKISPTKTTPDPKAPAES